MDRPLTVPAPPLARWHPVARVAPPAGLTDVGELGAPWAAAAWQAATAIAAGWRGEPRPPSPWGYPPPTAHPGYAPVAPPRPAPAVVPVTAPAPPRRLPTRPLGIAPA